MSEDKRKPAILILLNSNLDEEILTEVLHGIEEEGIPFRIKKDTLNNPFDLAYQAALESNLSVGIGCSNNELILTQRSISQDKCIMKIKISDSNEHKRSFGVNSARLVKGNAFKDLELMEV